MALSQALPVVEKDFELSKEGLGRVVVILPRGEAIRNFVYSGALERVAKSSSVTLLSIKPSERVWSDLQQRFAGVRELVSVPERYVVGALREVLDVCHGRWLWSEAAQERWRRRDLEVESVSDKIKRVSKKALVRPFANRPGLHLLSGMERTASRVLRTTNYYLDLYRKLQPSLVFNGSHVHSRNAVQAVEAAQWLGIPTATFIFSWDNLTSQGRVLPPYDHYLVWNNALKEQLLQIYDSIKPSQVFVTGTPQFDAHFHPEKFWSREEFCRQVGADPARPIVLYATGMPNHMPGEDEVVEGIADTLKGMSEFGPPQLLVRVYAKDRSGRFEPLKRRRPDILFPNVPWEVNWLTPLPEDVPLWTNTLRHCALGINVASTVSLELCMFDKPVINVAYNPPSVPEGQLSYARYYRFDHYAPVVASAAVKVAGSPEEMRAMIAEALRHPELGRPERAALLRNFFADTLDGRSGERVANVLLHLAGRNRSHVPSPHQMGRGLG